MQLQFFKRQFHLRQEDPDALTVIILFPCYFLEAIQRGTNSIIINIRCQIENWPLENRASAGRK